MRLSWRERRDPALEEPSLVLRVGELEGALVRLDGLGSTAEAA
jgi:hypothetical protein